MPKSRNGGLNLQFFSLAAPQGGINVSILSVGGILGIGDHHVAVRPSAVNLHRNGGAKKRHARMNATADQFKAAPEYKYAS